MRDILTMATKIGNAMTEIEQVEAVRNNFLPKYKGAIYNQIFWNLFLL
jgi:hypothetical protein